MLAALVVEQDGILEVGARVPRLVEAEEKRVPAAPRSRRCPILGDVDAARPRAVGGDRRERGTASAQTRERPRRAADGVDGRTSSSSRSVSSAASAVASSSSATRANSATNVRHPRASARRSQVGADASAESSSARAANSRARRAAARRRARRFGALGLFALAGLVRVAAAARRAVELGDQPVERGRVAPRAPADLRFAEGAGDRAGARPALGRAGKVLERQRSRGERLRAGRRPRSPRRSTRERREPPGPGA